MALASILYVDGSLKQVEVDKAVKAYEALTGITEPSEAQAEWLCTIKRIFLPPSVRPAGYEAANVPPDPDVSHLYHEGIQQGVSQQLPTGDRD
jgi:hypothetical protein